MIQKVPTQATEIDLPVCESTAAQKRSHRDFYHLGEEEKKNEETAAVEELSLVQ